VYPQVSGSLSYVSWLVIIIIIIIIIMKSSAERDNNNYCDYVMILRIRRLLRNYAILLSSDRIGGYLWYHDEVILSPLSALVFTVVVGSLLGYSIRCV
jgi:hypothetical protein